MYDENIQLIEQLIGLQKSSVKLYVNYSVLIISVGLGIILIGIKQKLSHGDTVITYGGIIFTMIGCFPLKELIHKKENIKLYKTLKSHLAIFKDNIERQHQYSNIIQGYFLKP